ncbi:MAG TPA: 4-(cytidine 5'-diphospho)-2-C-methyl-D-erythritol kinase [Verrucomicrobiae bacterium]
MPLTYQSHCKVNLILNILGKRQDGFHELETVMLPIPLHDTLTFERAGRGVTLTCSEPSLPVDASNLVHRAASGFLTNAKMFDGVKIHLEKRIPMAAGLGGGSGNAAITLLGMNELFGQRLPENRLYDLAAALGSDVPFFLQKGPALAIGRGEKVQTLPPFKALQGCAMLLIHPGFGVSTAWAYQNLARFPEDLNGRAGRSQELVNALNTADTEAAVKLFYNSLEAPVLEKHPILKMYQDFLEARGAFRAMMSGSGSTTFAVFPSKAAADAVIEEFKGKFGETAWIASVEL